MVAMILPALWLIVIIVGLPQLSETVYTPSLPEIAHSLNASEAMVEYTLTIYLFAFAIGTLLWGKISDIYGRKPCLMAGFAIFFLGCIGCYSSTSISMLMISRFVQAFGGSTGSVLGQAICRDAFHGAELGKVYSVVGSSLALFPAIGPVIGGYIAQHFGWYSIFLFLCLFTAVVLIATALYLPETLHADDRKKHSLLEISKKLFTDKKVLGFGLIVGACNGINFSYFAEGSFFLINLLGLSPSQYGLSFLGIALSTMMGGIVSKILQDKKTSLQIMEYGILIIVLSTTLFSGSILLSSYAHLSAKTLIGITITSQMASMFGVAMAANNALALALIDYKWCIGTASSLFGFFYYCCIALLTLGMGLIHNGTVLPMPLYFLVISLLTLLINHFFIKS